jgi:hypothetical protein
MVEVKRRIEVVLATENQSATESMLKGNVGYLNIEVSA